MPANAGYIICMPGDGLEVHIFFLDGNIQRSAERAD